MVLARRIWAFSLLAIYPGCSEDALPREPWNGNGGAYDEPWNGGAYDEPVEVLDPNAPPAGIVVLGLELDLASIQKLESNPFDGPDVLGAFIDQQSVRYPAVELNYRGAYALQSLIQSQALQRNWKVKFAKEQMYRNRREWNFNYESSIRQRLGYQLMRLAGLKVPEARHVLLSVNGQPQGIFLEYEDPDNKPFLLDKFGDDGGDLYKAAYDIPNQPKYFATLEYLGSKDSDYYRHYRKMTNNDDPAKAGDYSQLRGFLASLNQTSDSRFESFLRRNLDVDKFVSYLVVANFVSNWDSYPQRPKNFWLYRVPTANRWVFLPWDLDSTFQPYKSGLNPMGTDASIFYQFDHFVDYSARHPEEGTARPLVRRMMKVGAFRSAYVARYRQALSTFLAMDYLLAQVGILSELAKASALPDESNKINDVRSEMELFVSQRTASVTAELARTQ